MSRRTYYTMPLLEMQGLLKISGQSVYESVSFGYRHGSPWPRRRLQSRRRKGKPRVNNLKTITIKIAGETKVRYNESGLKQICRYAARRENKDQ